MCKVMAIAKIDDSNRSDCWVFAQLLGELMSFGNDDGLGYAAMDKDGKIFGEKWLINKTAFKDLTQIHGITSEKMARIYSYFGSSVEKDQAQAILLHTRAATCAKNIENTHPFIDDTQAPTVAIIHNGMIYNDEKFKKKYSTCDSEVIAHLYAESKVSTGLEKLNEFAGKLQGWFTVLALSKDETGRMVMDAFSDSGRLGSYFIKELNTRVYSTLADDVLRIAKQLGLEAVDRETMSADTAFRIDVLTGEQISHCKLASSTSVPVRVYPLQSGGEWVVPAKGGPYWKPKDWATGHDDDSGITTMSGNLSDDEFKSRWFGSNFGKWGGHRD